MNLFQSRVLIVLVICLGLCSCASVSVRDLEESTTSVPQTPPEKIYVMSFATDKSEFNVDREEKELEEFKIATGELMRKALVLRFNEHLGPTLELTQKQKLPKKGWLVMGRFVRVNQGSRALRVTVGFGAGGTKMETLVYVYDLSHRPPHPFLAFKTSGGSNAEPGIMARSVDPLSLISAGAGIFGGLAKGITDDTLRTSRMITAVLSQFMLQHQWITPEKALEPKLEGDIGPIIPE